MPSFMIGDILEPKRNLQSDSVCVHDNDEEDEDNWRMAGVKDISPIDLCTRLPFSAPPWLPPQYLSPNLRFSTVFDNHDPKTNEVFRGLLGNEDFNPQMNRHGFCGTQAPPSSQMAQASTAGIATNTTPVTMTSSNEDSATGNSACGVLGKCKKARKARTAFSDHQLNELERTFERQKYLSVQDRMQLAEKLHLSDMQVKTWYQNRRTKWKRQASVGMELLTEATSSVNRFLLQQQQQKQQLLHNSSGGDQRYDFMEPLTGVKNNPHLPSVDLINLFNNPSSNPCFNLDINVDMPKCLPLSIKQFNNLP